MLHLGLGLMGLRGERGIEQSLFDEKRWKRPSNKAGKGLEATPC